MIRLLTLACLLCLAGAAQPQVHGSSAGAPTLVLGGLPGVGPGLPGAASPVLDRVSDAARAGGAVTERMIERASPLDVRKLRIRQLVQQLPERIDLDPAGEPVLRGEFLAISPDAAGLQGIEAAGFEVMPREASLHGLDLDMRRIRDTRRRSAARAMRALRDAAPSVEFAYQHVFLTSSASATVAAGSAASPVGTAPATLRVGLIDSGVDPRRPELAQLRVQAHGCNGRPVPHAHGTAVAARLAGGAQGHLYAADVYCGDPAGRATLGLLEALAWMARERVPVINVSLVGPANAAIARAIAALHARGHVIVAAVGNDGPAAPPLYPAAYPGVVGVGAVDPQLRVLPESGSGPHVDFVASGVVPGRGRPTRGTSFAAPIVARAAALRIAEPDAAAAERLRKTLSADARDLGAPGRDPRYGDGLIAFSP
ncbi:S8 family serine peptidase [Cognatilysobacter bugurensis]|uniref:Peptidase S8/S53 domain-containing protein n=1 Tax=Cognatilysobacter bugurensis TaxID=543356 RepID=A0A918ST25_9GAMM|nr:S8 family serine peptidase [Lysobacter bugurensis]GHA69071.1 hypothetical protein GCM10007067_01220 [Lysobacter bugurensis]